MEMKVTEKGIEDSALSEKEQQALNEKIQGKNSSAGNDKKTDNKTDNKTSGSESSETSKASYSSSGAAGA